jgi:hypothetical protein
VDTRIKIITAGEAEQLAAYSSPRVVSGYFNPLRAEHARLLSEAARGNGRPLMVVVRPADPALLDSRARAELVAALAVVDYVVPIESDRLPAWVDSIHHADRLDIESVDESLTRSLVNRVRGRHS